MIKFIAFAFLLVVSFCELTTSTESLFTPVIGDVSGFTLSLQNQTNIRSLATGDVNGDHVDDIIIGSPDALNNSGQIYVFFGHANITFTPFDLIELNGTNGFIISSGLSNNRVGFSVHTADINGDGFSDILASGFFSGNNTGQVFVIFGQSDFPSNISLSSLNGTNGFVINNDFTNNIFGFSFSSGDFNNDTIDDVAISSLSSNRNANGSVYVIFGSSNIPFPLNFNLSSLNGSNGFIIDGDQYSFGHSLTAGDINGDFIDDIFIGSPFIIKNSGIVYVIFGSSNRFLLHVNVLELNGSHGFSIQGNEGFGFSLSSNDVSGDNIDDLMIVSLEEITSNFISAVFVIFGSSKQNAFASSLLSSDNFGMTNGVIIQGGEMDVNATWEVSSGDVNGDKIDDILIGSFSSMNGSFGSAFIIFGGFSQSLNYPNISVDSLDGPNGFEISEQISNIQFGSLIDNADVNGDGITDILISTIVFSPALFVFFGHTTTSTTSTSSSTITTIGTSFSSSTSSSSSSITITGSSLGVVTGTSSSSSITITGPSISSTLGTSSSSITITGPSISTTLGISSSSISTSSPTTTTGSLSSLSITTSSTPSSTTSSSSITVVGSSLSSTGLSTSTSTSGIFATTSSTTFSPTTTTFATTSTSSTTSSNNFTVVPSPVSKQTSSNTGKIVAGSVVGGLVFLGAIIIFAIYCLRSLRKPQYFPNLERNENAALEAVPSYAIPQNVGTPSPLYLTGVEKTALICTTPTGNVCKGVLPPNFDVVLKTVPPMTSEQLAAFEVEAATVKTLANPNIVLFYGLFQDSNDNVLYSVSEFVPIRLDALVCNTHPAVRDTLTLPILLKIGCDLATALAALEEKNIIHRHLSLHNILVANVDNEYVIKLDDVLSRYDQNLQSNIDNSLSPLKYCSPETILNNELTIQSNVFTFGVILWQILSLGQTPYSDIGNNSICDWLFAGNRLQPPINNETISEILSECWQISPSQRPSFKSIAAKLRNCLLALNQQNIQNIETGTSRN